MPNVRPWYKHYAKDWLGDVELRLCSPAARGLLEDIMCICHLATPYGYIKRPDGGDYTDRELCSIIHITPKAYRKHFAELLKRKRIVKDDIGVFVPRLIEERRKVDQFREYGKKGGNPAITDPDGPGDTKPPAGDDRPTGAKPGPRKPRKTPPAADYSYTDDFETFWSVYPRKIGKNAAFEKWLVALAAGITPAKIISGAKRYAADINSRSDVDLTFINHPATWLKGGRWDDVTDRETARKSQAAKRKAKARKEYEKEMSSFVEIAKAHLSADGKILKGGRAVLDRIRRDIKSAYGETAVADFNKRIEK